MLPKCSKKVHSVPNLGRLAPIILPRIPDLMWAGLTIIGNWWGLPPIPHRKSLGMPPPYFRDLGAFPKKKVLAKIGGQFPRFRWQKRQKRGFCGFDDTTKKKDLCTFFKILGKFVNKDRMKSSFRGGNTGYSENFETIFRGHEPSPFQISLLDVYHTLSQAIYSIATVGISMKRCFGIHWLLLKNKCVSFCHYFSM